MVGIWHGALHFPLASGWEGGSVTCVIGDWHSEGVILQDGYEV
jgi:hypothetical protein